jgi:hypothetical protein
LSKTIDLIDFQRPSFTDGYFLARFFEEAFLAAALRTCLPVAGTVAVSSSL